MATMESLSNFIVGREQEMRCLRTAIQQRESKLIWGRSDAGKTHLIQHVVAKLPESIRRKCICCAGAASGRQLVTQLFRELYLAGDPLIRRKVLADHPDKITFGTLDQRAEFIAPARHSIFSHRARGIPVLLEPFPGADP